MKTRDVIVLIIEQWEKQILKNKKIPPVEQNPKLDEDGQSKRDKWMMANLTQEERGNLVYLSSLKDSLPKLTDRFGNLELPLNG